AAFPDHGRTAEELVHRADTAMYEAKRDNRNCVKVAV
ncbi:MAG: diguanylate cyclase, partial [Acidobacteria bacterium]